MFDVHIFYFLSLSQEHEQGINQVLAVVLFCLQCILKFIIMENLSAKFMVLQN
jgi:heme/copper-type cytochrome/quinol oxidase subunit 4